MADQNNGWWVIAVQSLNHVLNVSTKGITTDVQHTVTESKEEYSFKSNFFVVKINDIQTHPIITHRSRQN